MSILNNTTKLQSLMDKINALPEQENLDEAISEQDSLISQIQDIVNNLPNAGSGGTNIEAWTGTVCLEALGHTPLAHYTDESMVYRTIEIPFSWTGDDVAEITIAANTIIYIDSEYNIYGNNIEILHEGYACLPTANHFEIKIS